MPQVYTNARLIDGLADQPQAGVSIVVDGERISQITGSEAPAPAGAEVIDLTGKTVVPGLIDTHVHATLLDSESLPLFIAAGVTTARDVGGKLGESHAAAGRFEDRRQTRSAAVRPRPAARRGGPEYGL